MKTIILQIGGMTCSACSSGLEKYLNKQKGIEKATINLILQTATIEYQGISLKTIEEYIEQAGFKSEGEFKSITKKETTKQEMLRLIFMGILLVSLVLITKATNIPYLKGLNQNAYIWISLGISLLFLVYGFSLLKSGWKNLLHKMPTMDSLVFLSVFFSFSYSLYSTIEIFLGNIEKTNHLYFEAVCMVLYFVKIGKFLENKSKDKTKDAIQELVSVTPTHAYKKEGEKIVKVDMDEIKENDRLFARPGEKIAVDGIVLSGKTHVDESFITGESKPVLKEKGSKVLAGAMNYDGGIEYLAKKIGKSSTISEIVTLVVEATNTKTKTQKLADKLSSYFVPFLLLFAFLVCGFQLLAKVQVSEVFLHFITIFVVACPCSLGLAVPLAVVVATNKCAKKGLFIRKSEVLEKAEKIDTLVLDKTGTLTYGKLNVCKVYNYLSIKESDLLNLVANLEELSTHPIKSAFPIKKKLPVTDFQNYEGKGISGKIGNNTYYLGNKKLVEERKCKEMHEQDYEELLHLGCTIIYVLEQDHVIGLIGVKDIVRENTKEIIEKMKKENIELIMLTGDNEFAAHQIAKELGIEKVKANCQPKEKAKYIKTLEEENHKVMMVGDGLNDAPALVHASIGVSIKEGTDVAVNASSVILMNNNLENLLDLLHTSKKAVKIMKQNIFLAMIYNIIMLPIAVEIIPFPIQINPSIGSIAMVGSSLLVIGNALRVSKE